MCTYINQDIPVCVLSSVSLEISLKSKLSPHQTVLCAWSEMTWHCWNMSQFWAPAAQCLWKNPPKKRLICLFTKQELSSSCVGSSGGSHRSRSQSRLRTNQVTAEWAHMFLQGVCGLISVSSSEWKILFQFRVVLCGFLFFQPGSVTFMFEIAAYLKETKAERRLGGGENWMVHTEMIFSAGALPHFYGKKKNKTKIAPFYHLKCYFFRIWSEILGHISVFCFFFCSQSLLSQLRCGRCSIIKTKLTKSLNLLFLPQFPHLQPPPRDHKSLLVPQL